MHLCGGFLYSEFLKKKKKVKYEDVSACVNACLSTETVLFLSILNSSDFINNQDVMVFIILVSNQNYSKGVPLTELLWTYSA